jgi:hypothetical protein
MSPFATSGYHAAPAGPVPQRLGRHAISFATALGATVKKTEEPKIVIVLDTAAPFSS